MGDESPDSSTEERIERVESVVKQQNETIREMLPGRRAVVAGGAAAALGFSAGSGSASGQSAAGQVGTSSEPVDVEAASVNAGSVNTDRTTIKESVQMDTENPFTIYVRSSGDDSNNGLSTSTAKATISGAVKAIPNIRVGSGEFRNVQIDLEDNQTYSLDGVEIEEPQSGEIQLLGNVGSQSDRPTIVSASGATAIYAINCRVRVDGIDFKENGNGGNRALRVERGGGLRIRDCSISGEYNIMSVHARTAVYLSIQDTVTITGASKSSGEAVRVHSTNNTSFNPTVEQFDVAFRLDRAATSDVLDASFVDCGKAIVAEDGADVKAVNDVTYTNCDFACVPIRGAFVQLDDGIDYTGVSDMFLPGRGGTVQMPDAKDPANQNGTHIYHGSGEITQDGPFSSDEGWCNDEPTFASAGMRAVASSSGWDPDSDGNAEYVTYDGSSWIEIVDYGTSL